MAAAAAAPSSVPTTPLSIEAAMAERDRKNRARSALRRGELIPTADVRPGDPWSQATNNFSLALAKAHKLSGGHMHYLRVVEMFDNRPCGYVTADYNDTTPPTLAQWSAWLDLSKPQIVSLRDELKAWGVIAYTEEDPMKVRLVREWEAWNPCVWEKQGMRVGAGRPRKNKPAEAVASDVTVNPQINTTPMQAPALIPDVTESYSTDYQALIPGITDEARQPRQEAAPRRPSKLVNRSKLEEPATQGASAPPAAKPPKASAAPKQAPAAAANEDPEAALYAHWPARGEGEMEQDYYLRILRVAKEQRWNLPAQVGLIAHRALGVHPTKHIGQLGGICNALKVVGSNTELRWALVVQAIVKANAAGPEGQSLDYVQKIAERLARERAAAPDQRPARGANFPTKRFKGGQDYWE